MRRLMLGLLIGALLAVPATLIAAPPKTTNVVTPMQRDLDANHYSVVNVAEFEAANAQLGTHDGNFGVLLLTDGTNDGTANGDVALIGGNLDPSTGFIGPVTPGSVYQRHNGTSGELWFKTGTANTAWSCIAGCS